MKALFDETSFSRMIIKCWAFLVISYKCLQSTCFLAMNNKFSHSMLSAVKYLKKMWTLCLQLKSLQKSLYE